MMTAVRIIFRLNNFAPDFSNINSEIMPPNIKKLSAVNTVIESIPLLND
jgi:hypothetical protein